jgi:Domain of unknown function DUF29
MARAPEAIQTEKPLYERDFCLWVEEQVRLLREGRLQQLDVVNLIDEIEDLGIHEKKAVESNLVVVLKHLLQHQFQPRRRSRSWLSSIAEHGRGCAMVSPPVRACARTPARASRNATTTAAARR